MVVARILFERLPLLVVDLAVAVSRHDRALLTHVLELMARHVLDALPELVLARRLVRLEVVDLLVPGVSCAHVLLSVAHHVLNRNVVALAYSSAAGVHSSLIRVQSLEGLRAAHAAVVTTSRLHRLLRTCAHLHDLIEVLRRQVR